MERVYKFGNYCFLRYGAGKIPPYQSYGDKS